MNSPPSVNTDVRCKALDAQIAGATYIPFGGGIARQLIFLHYFILCLHAYGKAKAAADHNNYCPEGVL
jgi:hypothetical protein